MNPILDRMQSYFELGGLFNPEMMEHDKVRDLIMDCRDEIQKEMKFSRFWAMPNRDTFSIPQIASMVGRYVESSKVSVDPFARNSKLATYRNDLNPLTSAEYHFKAEDFLGLLKERGVKCDLALFDPPYSPRQISECYQSIGLPVKTEDTQNAALYSRVRDALMYVLTPDATVLSFGWNSNGMGIKRGFKIVEIQLIAHGSAHNDTICIAEKRQP